MWLHACVSARVHVYVHIGVFYFILFFTWNTDIQKGGLQEGERKSWCFQLNNKTTYVSWWQKGYIQYCTALHAGKHAPAGVTRNRLCMYSPFMRTSLQRLKTAQWSEWKPHRTKDDGRVHTAPSRHLSVALLVKSRWLCFLADLHERSICFPYMYKCLQHIRN